MIRHSLHKWTALLLVLHLFSNTQGQTLGAVTARQDASTIVISVADLQDASLDDLDYFYSTDAGQQWAEISKDCLTFEGAKTRWDVLNCLGVDVFEGNGVQFKVTLSSCEPVRFDGYTYRVVQIGSQCWFAENLRTAVYANGDAIPGNLFKSEWKSTTSGAQAVYDNDNSNLETYGRLYNWYAVDDARGLCPSGWHVPTDGEWSEMTDFLGGASVAGKLMKSSSSDEPSWDGINESGFSALPGGWRHSYDGLFSDEGLRGYWWSASPYGASFAWYRELKSGNASLGRYASYIRYGISVRCVRD